MSRSMENAEQDAAGLRARIGGYVVDMVIFSALSLVMLVIAGFVLLASTHWAEEDASNRDFYTFLGIIGAGIPAVWTALNVSLLGVRGQTGGQYVAAIRTVAEDGARISFRRAAGWWFCFNPLLFSWPMALIVGLPLSAVVFLAVSRAAIVVFGVVVTVAVAAPLIALVSAALDGEHRALHDRIAGTRAVPAG